MVLNNFREKGNLWYKLLYKVFEIIYVYDPLLDIYLFSTLIPLSNFLYGIQHSVKTVSKWIFIAIFLLHFLFLLVIWITAAQMMTKIGINVEIVVFKYIWFFSVDKIDVGLRSKRFINYVWYYKDYLKKLYLKK